VVELHAGGDLDGEDRCDHPINHKTEGRPPARVGNKLTPVLPEVFETVASEPNDEQPRRACTAAAAMMTNMLATPLSTARTVRRPSATAKPM
jgi:hypothetical protein